MKFHLCNSSGKLNRCGKQLFTVGESAIQRIQQLLPVTQVDIVLYHNPSFVIPETGICGNAPTPHAVWIALDPDNPNFDRNLDEEFTATLAHELHHCMRWRGPGTGYFTSLRDALITDGLAVAFELEFRRAKSSLAYLQELSDEEAESLLTLARDEFEAEAYDHREWFFSGSSARNIPQFAGYRLGYRVVKDYISLTGRSAASLWHQPARDFF
jgi:uncharacterized protein YjaZ